APRRERTRSSASTLNPTLVSRPITPRSGAPHYLSAGFFPRRRFFRFVVEVRDIVETDVAVQRFLADFVPVLLEFGMRQMRGRVAHVPVVKEHVVNFRFA